MANASQEMFQVCRFCLCQDEELLIPFEDILDFGLDVQDVSTVTGIEINEENIASYAMCLECTTNLKSAVTFRNTCLSNESQFQELYAVLAASVEELHAQNMGSIVIVDSSDESMDGDLNFSDTFRSNKATGSSQSVGEVSQNEKFMVERDESSLSYNSEEEEFSYSANYIQSGEILYSEKEDSNQSFDWYSSLNPPAPPPVLHLRERRKLKLHVCEYCGLKVTHIPSHINTHKEECTYSCPYCSVKMRRNGNLRQHIKTVHMKTIMKTCDICGKGFIHHKTYRYHMLTHQGEGKTFECVDCSKTFSNSIYLRDHINRLHNAGKQIKKKVPLDPNRIKRNRSRPQSSGKFVD